ncbi:MAG: YihY/virulence factor BrkB family protein [Clostridiales bacterium]|nr:YihY/virulence factor BrkB family protein [Clostridiales bacterium]
MRLADIREFSAEIIRETARDELFTLAGQVTYKLLLAFFPLVIFFMSVIGFFNIDGELLLKKLSPAMPEEVIKIIRVFVEEVAGNKNLSLLSLSLALSLYSAASGFAAIARGVSKTFGGKVLGGFVKIRAISVLLVLIFTFALITAMSAVIFRERALSAMWALGLPPALFAAYRAVCLFIAPLVLFLCVLCVYKLTAAISWLACAPGALFAVSGWWLASKVFNGYVRRFFDFSKVYGSIGGLFVLLVWLNMSSVVLLIGSEINAAALRRRFSQDAKG